MENFKRNIQKWSKIKQQAVFLDRDGVIIEDVHFIKKVEDVQLCRGVKELFHKLDSLNIAVVIVTNQSGISRGYSTWCDYNLVTDRMLELLGNPECLAGIYANATHPTSKSLGWRKPSPKMLLEASIDINIVLSQSIIIGDRLSDLQAGSNAKLKSLIHVLTGHGKESRPSVVEWYENQRTVCRRVGEINKSGTSLILLDDLKDFPLRIVTNSLVEK